MATFTTRELRHVAAILDGLNKARAHNTRMGVPTTPDELTARFPTGLVAVVRWTEGVQSDDPKRQRVIENRARHRDGYQLDLDTPADPKQAVTLQDPQPVKRGHGHQHGRPSVVVDTDEVVRASLARQDAQRAHLGLD